MSLLKRRWVDNDITDELLREVTMLKNIEEATSEHEVICTHRVQAQRRMLNSIKES